MAGWGTGGRDGVSSHQARTPLFQERLRDLDFVFACVCVHVCVCMHVCMFCMCVCMFVCVRMHVQLLVCEI